jgi:hypothetical protein
VIPVDEMAYLTVTGQNKSFLSFGENNLQEALATRSLPKAKGHPINRL